MAQYVTKADEFERNFPSPFSDLARLSQLPKIPENIEIINWYGADLVGPFTLYFALRFINHPKISATAQALALPILFELIQYAARNLPDESNLGGRFDPIDVGCYVAGTAGAVAVDNWISKKKSPNLLQQAPQVQVNSAQNEKRIRNRRNRRKRNKRKK